MDRVLWADEFRPDGIAASDHDVNLAAGLGSIAWGAGGVVGKHPLAATQIGNAHGRKLHAAKLFGRKGDRHPDDAVENSVFAQDAPKRLAPTEQPDLGLAQGELVLAQANRSPGRPDLHGTELRLIGAPIRLKKVEDIVLPRIDAGLK